MQYNGIQLTPALDFSGHDDFSKPAPPLLINGKQAYALPGGGYIVP